MLIVKNKILRILLLVKHIDKLKNRLKKIIFVINSLIQEALGEITEISDIKQILFISDFINNLK